ncbi:MAG: hypothetical protein EOR97_13020 [Mesorhizobium sp.]|uniref:hypothetical protein n=1 Tax=Mesorhizobium sp. TaxID=1871066 RepID=UPI000FE9E8ED|nr:hypothetical protein [Mesorhizobium sp.]RWN31103.1 MAG: hypothetical protein EOR97_13020 [Mesorhizobium sp.]
MFDDDDSLLSYHPRYVFGEFEDWDAEEIDYLIQELRKGYCDGRLGVAEHAVGWIPAKMRLH